MSPKKNFFLNTFLRNIKIEQQQEGYVKKPCMDAAQAKELMTKMKQFISCTEATYENVDALFESVGINQYV